ncbi:hypothetical protein P3102_03120 [Amycolatopsis sp. QT-25]|uniref:hypothetical protein n=1 Tax=Amycolatopsis sp. QT-25 TaxID=3034022 RepID=UPI0023EE2885|nr:hypothetical protein [Amycolatopsis sp. QT-25]WET80257.1 hypothetical protein P3102_03120 [Amycolatopsis sp. QT-25]
MAVLAVGTVTYPGSTTSAYADKEHGIQNHLVQNLTASQRADGKRRKWLTTYALDVSRLGGPPGRHETALSFGLSRSETSTHPGEVA